MKRIFRHPDGSDRAARDVNRELALHLELRAREFEALGMSHEDARRAAREAFGDVEAIEHEVHAIHDSTVRERQRRDWLGDLRQDLVIGMRGLRRAPGFTLVALLTLAMGIGGNTAIFSVLRSVVLRPLPYANPDQLVQAWTDHRPRGREAPEWLSPAEFADWRDQNRTLAGIAAYQGWGPDVTGDGGDPETIAGLVVSGNFFDVLGARPALGRPLAMSDDAVGTEPVVLLSDAFWHRRFGGDSTIVGRTITLSGLPWRVIGVLAPTFRAPIQTASPDVYRAIRRPPTSGCGRGCVTLRVIGRLRPGVSVAAAQADLTGIAQRTPTDGSQPNANAWLIPLQEQLVGPVKLPLLALTGAVAIVLLIGCVNLANLLLVRGTGREREIVVRTALGAPRSRIVRQLLTENGLLAAIGGALGLALGIAGSRVLGLIVPESVRRVQDIQVDASVLVFAAGITLLAGMAFGLLPALNAARPNLIGSLRDGRGATGHHAALGNGLVVAQLSLAVVLLVSAGLLLRSFMAMQQVDLGFREHGVVLTGVAFPPARYQEPARFRAVTADLLTRLRANPAVRSVEISDVRVMSPGDQDITVVPLGRARPASAPSAIWYRSVTPEYPSVMGMRLVEGRQFDATDRQGSLQVGILNEEAARRLFPGESAVGKMIAAGESPSAPKLTIVGVLASARHDGPNQPFKSELFIPFDQFPTRSYNLAIEPARDLAALTAAYAEAMRDVDPLMPVSRLEPIEQFVGEAVALPRLYAVLVGIFATAALLLAALGVYGVMAYAVAQRKREIGVRLALGANPADIRSLVLVRGVRLTVIGMVIGLVAARGLGRVIETLLFGVTAFDLTTLVAVTVVLGALALVASWVPARRAMRLDPVSAMREE